MLKFFIDYLRKFKNCLQLFHFLFGMQVEQYSIIYLNRRVSVLKFLIVYLRKFKNCLQLFRFLFGMKVEQYSKDGKLI